MASNWRGFVAGCLAALGVVGAALALPGVPVLGAAFEGIGASDRAGLQVVAGNGQSRAADGAMRGADPDRLVGPLSMLLDADPHRGSRHVTGEPLWNAFQDPPREVSRGAPRPAAGSAASYAVMRHRYRLLSWHVIAPIEGLAGGAITGGEVVVVEDSDDDVATAIVYHFARDGTVAAITPGGNLLGTFDPGTPTFLAQLRNAARQRIVIDGRE